MKNTIKATLLLAGVCTTGFVFGQQNSSDDRYDRNRNDQPSRRDERRDDRRMNEQFDDRRNYNQRQDENNRYDNRYEERMENGRGQNRQYDQQDLSKAYDEGFEDGQRDAEVTERKEHRENYKHFTFGVYAGGNTTRFKGETVDGNSLSGRLGYQLGFFVRGGGRIYGQIGAEYQTSSSDFYRSGDGSTVKDITSNIDQRYIQVPALIGVKVAQSERGVSGIRLAVGAELATPVGVGSNQFEIDKAQFQDVTFNGLANLGFDVGPLFIDIVYHQGFSNVLKNQAAGSPNSQRQILGANVGIKF